MTWLQIGSGHQETAEATGPTPVQVLKALVSIQTVFYLVLLCGTLQHTPVVSSALPAAFMKAKALLIWSSLSLSVCSQQGWREHHTQPSPPERGPLQYKPSSSGACLWPIALPLFW